MKKRTVVLVTAAALALAAVAADQARYQPSPYRVKR
jgi:hypothetical protein